MTRSFTHFLKGDVSGIQDFIFSVQSKGAAKSLKARSFYIQAVCEVCVARVREILNEVELFYNGGGNFYLFCNITNKNSIKVLQQELDQQFRRESLHVILSYVSASTDFKTMWNAIQVASNEDKLRRYADSYVAFQPFQRSGYDESFWKKTTDKLKKDATASYNLFVNGNQLNFPSLVTNGIRLQAALTNVDNFQGKITNKLPLWSDKLLQLPKYKTIIQEYQEAEDAPAIDTIIEFEYLAAFAKERTGTEKLGILKMDVDNLGDLFRGIKDQLQAQALSSVLRRFFEEEMLTLWKSNFNKNQDSFQDNIYVVFSGGDDCFMLGAWDAVFAFAKIIRDAFANFIRQELQQEDITLSAALLLVDEKFPVIRFAELAEEALKAAKYKDFAKNKIAVFGRVLTWEEFDKANLITQELVDLISEKAEPRSILDRIQSSHIGYDKLQKEALNGKIVAPKVWRLFYYLRNVRNQDQMQRIIDEYSKALISAATAQKTTNPEVFPVAARWAEFLTRKKLNQYESTTS